MSNNSNNNSKYLESLAQRLLNKSNLSEINNNQIGQPKNLKHKRSNKATLRDSTLLKLINSHSSKGKVLLINATSSNNLKTIFSEIEPKTSTKASIICNSTSSKHKKQGSSIFKIDKKFAFLSENQIHLKINKFEQVHPIKIHQSDPNESDEEPRIKDNIYNNDLFELTHNKLNAKHYNNYNSIHENISRNMNELENCRYETPCFNNNTLSSISEDKIITNVISMFNIENIFEAFGLLSKAKNLIDNFPSFNNEIISYFINFLSLQFINTSSEISISITEQSNLDLSSFLNKHFNLSYIFYQRIIIR